MCVQTLNEILGKLLEMPRGQLSTDGQLRKKWIRQTRRQELILHVVLKSIDVKQQELQSGQRQLAEARTHNAYPDRL